jgi:hypothetical protein
MEIAGHENQTPITTRHGKGNSMMPWSYLLVPPGGGWLTEKSRALCISPNGTFIGGNATRTQTSPALQEQTAVYWSGTTMSNLFSELTLELGRAGEARAVDNAEEFVGSRKLLNGVGQYNPKAFRSRSNGAMLESGDFLIPPPQPNLAATDTPSAALAISERNGSQSGIAVGWAGRRIDEQFRQRPVVWWGRSNGGAEPDNTDWIEITAGSSTATGQANAINSYSSIYGWVRLIASSDRRAARWEQGWKSTGLPEDQFEVYGYSDQWVLEEFVDARGGDVILGNGKKNGAARAFLLIPQATAN